MTEPVGFNPFNHVLAADERYRIKDGKLTVEKSKKRAKSWFKFFTRGQYSQAAILAEMGKLYLAAKKEQNENAELHINNTFLQNYKTLVNRAVTQNKACSKMNIIARFFNARMEINVDDAQVKIKKIINEIDEQKIKELEAKDVFKAESKTPWWTEEDPDDDTILFLTTDNFIAYPYQLLAPLGKQANEGNVTQQLDALLKTFEIYTVGQCKANGIQGPLHLEVYLLKNKGAFLKKLETLEFVE